MFDKFPKRWWGHSNTNEGHTLFVNLCKRVAIPDAYRNNTSLYLEYKIKDGETAMDIAEKLYGNANLWWVILLTNQIMDITTQWPVMSYDYQLMIERQHGFDELLHIHQYEDSLGNINDPAAIRFAENLDADYTVEEVAVLYGLKPITLEDYLVRKNERLRDVKLIDPDYVNNFVKDLEVLINE
mgnify:CR=1 FL=1